jgi:hypothetical protein
LMFVAHIKNLPTILPIFNNFLMSYKKKFKIML